MMHCKEYTFLLTSGQLDAATGVQRFWAAQHRLICPRCRAFTRNDRVLDQVLAPYRDHLGLPPAVPDDAPR